ncbi:hypothetical protein BD560DRAFT_393135 [Blakeslea trispora]|nr:hypothetical protein BD560DRAFT_393135 [Blakeslea trispora]
MKDIFSSVKDKVAVVAGGASGIGEAVASALIEHGAKVVIGDIQDVKGTEIVNTYNQRAGKKVAAFLRTDVSKYSDNIALFQLAESEFGGVDIAFLNAGIAEASNSTFGHLSDEEEAKLLSVNLFGVIKGTKVAMLHMAKRGGGTIVHTASFAGIYPLPLSPLYTASKHAVVGYTRSLHLLPEICNIRVNAICPSWVDTNMISRLTSKEAEDMPLYNYFKVAPRATLESVVEAFFTLVSDPSRVSQTLLVLPTGIQAIDAPEVPESASTSEAAQTYLAELPKLIARAKVQYQELVEIYKATGKIPNRL